MKSSDAMVDGQGISKVVVRQHLVSKEKTTKETKRDQQATRVFEAVAKVRAEVDKLSEKVVALERNVHGRAKCEDKDFAVLTELFMMQLLKLDAIEADGEAKLQRKIEVTRVQSFVDKLDDLRARNSNMLAPPQAKQELLLTGAGHSCLCVPPKPSTVITLHWELFD